MTEYKLKFQNKEEAITAFGDRFYSFDENGDVSIWNGDSSLFRTHDDQYIKIVNEIEDEGFNVDLYIKEELGNLVDYQIEVNNPVHLFEQTKNQ